ncbi:hypothetical protein MRX96_005958 [Rhipicephalus microplus]
MKPTKLETGSQLLPWLPKKRGRRTPPGQEVVILGDVAVPAGVKKVLQNGQTFCETPNLDKFDLLGFVRSTVGRAKDDEIGRLVQEKVDCLPQDVKTARQRSSALVASLRKAEVKLLQSDKQGGFVLMPKHLYDSKVEEAMRKNFKVFQAIKGARVRSQAAKLCD